MDSTAIHKEKPQQLIHSRGATTYKSLSLSFQKYTLDYRSHSTKTRIMPPSSSSPSRDIGVTTHALWGTHVPLIVFGVIVLIIAFIRMMVNKRKIEGTYRRMYCFSLIASLFLIASTSCTIVGYYHIRNITADGITSINTTSEIILVAAIVFDYLFPMILWWVIFEILTVVSRPRLRNDYPELFKRSSLWSFQSVSYLYTMVLLIVYLISALTINPIAGLSLIDILMGGYLALLGLCLYSQSRYQDVQPLGWTFTLFGFLIVCTAIGGIVRGAMSVDSGGSSSSASGMGYTDMIAPRTIVSFILIKYFGALALILLVVVFPSKWAIHIQGVQGRYKRMSSFATLVDDNTIEEPDSIIYHQQQQQQSEASVYQQDRYFDTSITRQTYVMPAATSHYLQ
ncbi:hypothetical protein BDA99DRAFT_607047 [Phascolomyces articulosus]|uniref:Uncharacterized protein n=1 Tax=Phascolomyces articulosus TaxID=60185 RepID=A0AAD5PBI3_9FUNG|nr:hypothetical protein BDA99DRAFT_607047 [Phascolomyces articulosus]